MTPISSTALVEEVYDRIRSMILEGEVKPGSKIERRWIATVLGVSLTPVNEAVARLVGERFLERRIGPKRSEEGLFVPLRPEEELVHVFAVRAGIEGIAGRLCAERARDGAEPELFKTLCSKFEGFSDPVGEHEEEKYLAEDKAFHECIIKYADNPVLHDLDTNLGLVHRSWIRGLVRQPRETLSEHRAIIAALKRFDPEATCTLLMDHNLRSRAVLISRNRDAAQD